MIANQKPVRTVMATCGLAGGTQMATRDPSPNRASRIGRGKRAGPSGSFGTAATL